jgi:hypothetical protein
MPISSVPPPLPRSALLTAFAWVVIGLSALVLPISFISVLMVVAGHPGTQNVEPLGAFTVLVGPTMTLVAGIGLLRRQRWAWWILVLSLVAIIVSNVRTMIRVESGPSHYVSPSGVPTTVYKTSIPSLGPIIGASVLALGFLLTRRVRAECRGKAPSFSTAELVPPACKGGARGWRVGHAGRDCIYYEERVEGRWQRIEINGEMLMGTPHHVVYFRSAEDWRSYPDWARDRRAEIIARIKSEFREPDYEYAVGASTAAIAAAVATARTIAPPPLAARPTQGMGAFLVFIVLFLALAGGMGWLVQSGLGKGETWWPAKRASQSRAVLRAGEPAMFWTAIGLYTAIGLGSAGFAAWLGKEGVRLRRR